MTNSLSTLLTKSGCLGMTNGLNGLSKNSTDDGSPYTASDYYSDVLFDYEIGYTYVYDYTPSLINSGNYALPYLQSVWISNQTNPWLQLNIGPNMVLSKITIGWPANTIQTMYNVAYISQSFSSFILQGSDNGSTYTNVQTVTLTGATSYICIINKKYQYWRISFTNTGFVFISTISIESTPYKSLNALTTLYNSQTHHLSYFAQVKPFNLYLTSPYTYYSINTNGTVTLSTSYTQLDTGILYATSPVITGIFGIKARFEFNTNDGSAGHRVYVYKPTNLSVVQVGTQYKINYTTTYTSLKFTYTTTAANTASAINTTAANNLMWEIIPSTSPSVVISNNSTYTSYSLYYLKDNAGVLQMANNLTASTATKFRIDYVG